MKCTLLLNLRGYIFGVPRAACEPYGVFIDCVGRRKRNVGGIKAAENKVGICKITWGVTCSQ